MLYRSVVRYDLEVHVPPTPRDLSPLPEALGLMISQLFPVMNIYIFL
jgi:hypothetical protein